MTADEKTLDDFLIVVDALTLTVDLLRSRGDRLVLVVIILGVYWTLNR
jgi:hypothetical protein